MGWRLCLCADQYLCDLPVFAWPPKAVPDCQTAAAARQFESTNSIRAEHDIGVRRDQTLAAMPRQNDRVGGGRKSKS